MYNFKLTLQHGNQPHKLELTNPQTPTTHNNNMARSKSLPVLALALGGLVAVAVVCFLALQQAHTGNGAGRIAAHAAASVAAARGAHRRNDGSSTTDNDKCVCECRCAPCDCPAAAPCAPSGNQHDAEPSAHADHAQSAPAAGRGSAADAGVGGAANSAPALLAQPRAAVSQPLDDMFIYRQGAGGLTDDSKPLSPPFPDTQLPVLTRKVQQLIWENQHPPDCSTAKYVVFRTWWSGIGSTLATYSNALSVAMELGRVLVLDPGAGSSYVDSEFCKDKSK